jgi:hypothetical protein
MAHELSQNSEEIQKYHAEQAVVFNRIRELVGNSAEIINKAHLYDRMMASGEPASAKQALPILVKYTQTMKDLLAEIQKVVPPGRTPRRVLCPGLPGSPTGTLYEVVGEVALVQNPPTTAGTSQQENGARLASPGKDPSGTRFAGARRKNTGSARSGQDQSPVRRTSYRSQTPNRARSPIRNPEPAASPSKGKGPVTQALATSPADCQMTSPRLQPPSRAASSWDPRATPSSGRQDPVQHLGDDLSPIRSVRKGSRTPGIVSGTLGTVSGMPGTISGPPGSGISRVEGAGDSEDEIAPSPNMRRVLTRL